MNLKKTNRINSYLSFKIGDEVFAANVKKVLNILEMTKITKVPKVPNYMKGIINLRGTVLPVIDARIKFEMPAIDITNNTCILVLEIEKGKKVINVGAMVDSVQEVLEINDESIQDVPEIGADIDFQFIEGMYKNEDEFTILLNMDVIFTSDELVEIQNYNKDTLELA